MCSRVVLRYEHDTSLLDIQQHIFMAELTFIDGWLGREDL